MFYRGEGKIVHDDDGFSGKPAAPAAAASSGAVGDADAASEVASTPPKKRKPEPAPPVALRRIVVEVHIATPGSDSETIDEGVFRGVVDIDDQWIHGRLWLKSEQAERVMDLRRGG